MLEAMHFSNGKPPWLTRSTRTLKWTSLNSITANKNNLCRSLGQSKTSKRTEIQKSISNIRWRVLAIKSWQTLSNELWTWTYAKASTLGVMLSRTTTLNLAPLEKPSFTCPAETKELHSECGPLQLSKWLRMSCRALLQTKKTCAKRQCNKARWPWLPTRPNKQKWSKN